MKIRNKSTTAYRDGKHTILPGQTVEVTAHDGHELMKVSPWLFEEIKPGQGLSHEAGAASKAGGDSGASAERTAPTSRSRGRER